MAVGLLDPIVGMRASLSTAMIGLVAVGCGGCILPVPHTRVHAFGVTGQVVSVVDHSPVGGASIASIDEPTETAHCDSGGNFRLRARRGWHAAYQVSPICQSLLPGWDLAYPGREIRVSASGYLTKEFSITAFPGGRDHEVTGEMAGAYLKAGQLELALAEDDPTDANKTAPIVRAFRYLGIPDDEEYPDTRFQLDSRVPPKYYRVSRLTHVPKYEYEQDLKQRKMLFAEQREGMEYYATEFTGDFEQGDGVRVWVAILQRKAYP